MSAIKFFPKKKVNVRARLRRPNYANYLKYYHEKSALEDPFYKLTVQLIDELALITRVDRTEIKGYSNEGFYFKNDKTMYLDIHKKPCLAESICDRDVMIMCTIQQYNFEADGNRHTGVSITATEVREIREKE
jgi:hypothetical protein